MLKTQQGFKSERPTFFTEQFNKTALSSNDDKRMLSIDSIERYEYGTSKNVTNEKEEIKFKKLIKQYKNC